MEGIAGRGYRAAQMKLAERDTVRRLVIQNLITVLPLREELYTSHYAGLAADIVRNASEHY